MDWSAIGARIRKQREYMGYTREQFAEMLDVTPKFCSDIELGIKGMSVPTLCKISKALLITTDYILWGKKDMPQLDSLYHMLQGCTETERIYAEKLLKTFLMAMDAKKDSL